MKAIKITVLALIITAGSVVAARATSTVVTPPAPTGKLVTTHDLQPADNFVRADNFVYTISGGEVQGQ